MKTLIENVKAAISLIPEDFGAGANNGEGVDTQDFNQIMGVVQSGAVGGTNPTLDVKVQDSADNSSFADVSGLTFTQILAADKLHSLKIPKGSVRRYIRLVGTVGGTSTPTVLASGLILLGIPLKGPITNT